MLELRLGEGAELEIRRMAVACLRVLQQEAPALFADFEIYQSPEGGEAGRVGFHKVLGVEPGQESGVSGVRRRNLNAQKLADRLLRLSTLDPST